MKGKASTIAEYIRAAPKAGQPHLRKLYSILKAAAPDADEAIKWGQPFFVNPRFVYAFSAYRSHLNFAPTPDALKAFAKELAEHKTTKNYLQVPYDHPLPEDLIRKIAEYRVRNVGEGESFW